MAGINDDSHSKTSRLNTPRGSAGSSRQRDHKSYVRGRYASLDASNVNGSWAQRAAEARRANEERARRTGKTSEYEQRAREARNRQFDNEPAPSARSYEPVQRERSRQSAEEPLPWERPNESAARDCVPESNSRVRSSSIYDQNDSVSRLFERRDRAEDDFSSSERSISSYEREARLMRWREQVAQQERENTASDFSQDTRTARSDRRTVKLGSRPELEHQYSSVQDDADDFEQEYNQDYEQGYDADYGSDYGSDYYQEEYDDEYEDDSDGYYDSGYEQDSGLLGRVRGLASDAAGAVRASSFRARIIGGAIIVIIIAAILYIAFAGSGQTASSTQASKTSSSASSSVSSTASAKGVADPWIDGGVFSTGDAELDKYVKEFCDSESSKNASAAENAYKGFITVAWSNYIERDNAQNPQGSDWAKTYALQWFTNGKSGNYFEFAAVTQYVLQYYGYSDAKAEACQVELENGSWANHGLVFVTDISSGQSRVCDDAMGTNGWMLDLDSLNYKKLDSE